MDILTMPMIRLFFTTFMLLLFTERALAQSDSIINNPASSKPQVANIVSSPGHCELKPGQEVCEVMLNLIWEAPKAAHYCLWQQGSDAPLKCWTNTWRGSAEFSFSGIDRVEFELKDGDNQQVVAQTSVSVTGSYKQRKRAQRRKRGFWRMF